MQGQDAMRQGPTRHGPSCLTPLLPLLRSQVVPERMLPVYAVAWHLLRVVIESGPDDCALLGRLTLDGTLTLALSSSLWRGRNFEVRPSTPCTPARYR